MICLLRGNFFADQDPTHPGTLFVGICETAAVPVTWEDSSSSDPPHRTRGHQLRMPRASIGVERHCRKVRAMPIPVPGPMTVAHGYRDHGAAVGNWTVRNRPTRSSSGGACRSPPRPPTVAWRNGAIASRVMFLVLSIMMNLMRPITPEMPSKFLDYRMVMLSVCHEI